MLVDCRVVAAAHIPIRGLEALKVELTCVEAEGEHQPQKDQPAKAPGSNYRGGAAVVTSPQRVT